MLHVAPPRSSHRTYRCDLLLRPARALARLLRLGPALHLLITTLTTSMRRIHPRRRVLAWCSHAWARAASDAYCTHFHPAIRCRAVGPRRRQTRRSTTGPSCCSVATAKTDDVDRGDAFVVSFTKRPLLPAEVSMANPPGKAHAPCQAMHPSFITASAGGAAAHVLRRERLLQH